MKLLRTQLGQGQRVLPQTFPAGAGWWAIWPHGANRSVQFTHFCSDGKEPERKYQQPTTATGGKSFKKWYSMRIPTTPLTLAHSFPFFFHSLSSLHFFRHQLHKSSLLLLQKKLSSKSTPCASPPALTAHAMKQAHLPQAAKRWAQAIAVLIARTSLAAPASQSYLVIWEREHGPSHPSWQFCLGLLKPGKEKMFLWQVCTCSSGSQDMGAATACKNRNMASHRSNPSQPHTQPGLAIPEPVFVSSLWKPPMSVGDSEIWSTLDALLRPLMGWKKL